MRTTLDARRWRSFPVVLSSPSGAGKTSIIRGVTARDKTLFYSISATTRARRPGEVDGRDYHFWSRARFAAAEKRSELLESAEVYGHRYGTPRRPIMNALKQGRNVIADLDIQGAHSLKKLIPEAVLIFVTAPDSGELAARLKRRRTDSPEEIRRRLACLPRELAERRRFDYLVVNASLEQAIDDVFAIIRAERLSTKRARVGC